MNAQIEQRQIQGTVTDINEGTSAYGVWHKVEINGESWHMNSDKNYVPQVGDIITALMVPKPSKDGEKTFWNLTHVEKGGQSIPKERPAPAYAQPAPPPYTATTTPAGSYSKKDLAIAAQTFVKAGVTDPLVAVDAAKTLLETIYHPTPPQQPKPEMNALERKAMEMAEQATKQSTDFGDPQDPGW